MRVWIGLVVTVVFVWLALRDVPFAEVGRVIAHADWLVLVGWSVPAYLVMVWVRALRWRHLTNPIQPMSVAAVTRAVAVGFMANNIFPLRMGEVVRAWYLGRETGASVAAVFATVILERVIDIVCVLVMVLMVVGLFGSAGGGALSRGALLLLPVAVLPILFLVVLQRAPDRAVALVVWPIRPFSERLAVAAEDLLRRFSQGLGALRGGSHLFWIAVESAVIWLVLATIPTLAAFRALEMDLGSAWQTLGAAWTTQAAIGVAVALPSAPGFFGIFHFACKLALVRFGVSPETAVAAGTLIHATMWLTLTGAGLLVLRSRRTSLGEVDQAASSASEPPPGKAGSESRR